MSGFSWSSNRAGSVFCGRAEFGRITVIAEGWDPAIRGAVLAEMETQLARLLRNLDAL